MPSERGARPKRLKVFGLLMWNHDCPPAPNGSRQVRHIVAATSQKEAARLFGTTLGDLRNYGGVTGNAQEIAQAMSSPGTVFWSVDRYSANPVWRKARVR